MVSAQQQVQKKSQLSFKEAVEICVLIVRQETFNRIHTRVDEFDAYVKADGVTTSMYGSVRERFSFGKCMNDLEHRLEFPNKK
jgi:hypothetical protein